MSKCARTKGDRSALKRHGGKANVAGWIVGRFPSHRMYVDPFVGAGSVLLTHADAGREVAADLDAQLVNFWRVLRDRPTFLPMRAAKLAYSRETFDAALGWLDHADLKMRALGFLVRNRMSRSGLGADFARPGEGTARLRGGLPDNVNAWKTAVEIMPRISDRIQCVDFRCEDGVAVVRSHDDPDALVYLDPPYMLESRTAWDCYEFEVTDPALGREARVEADRAWHSTLLGAALASRAKCVISGYRTDLYDSMLKDWERADFEVANHSGQGKTKTRRVESIWIKA